MSKPLPPGDDQTDLFWGLEEANPKIIPTTGVWLFFIAFTESLWSRTRRAHSFKDLWGHRFNRICGNISHRWVGPEKELTLFEEEISQPCCSRRSEWTEVVWELWKTSAASYAEDVLRLVHTTSGDVCYRLWHMLLICLSPVMCCTTLYSSALIFPPGKQVCVHVCVGVCPAEALAWVFIGPSVQRFPASFGAVWLGSLCLLQPVSP